MKLEFNSDSPSDEGLFDSSTTNSVPLNRSSNSKFKVAH